MKLFLIAFAIYLIGIYTNRFLFGLLRGNVDPDDMRMTYFWPVFPLFLFGIGIEVLIDKIIHSKNRYVRIFRMFLYVLSFPFRPSEFGAAIHRLTEKHRDKASASSRPKQEATTSGFVWHKEEIFEEN